MREKGGVPLNLTFATSQSEVRQNTQAVIKGDWEEMGFAVELLQIEAIVFFDTSAGNDQTFYHMYRDVHEYAWSPAGPYPLSYMLRWVSHDGENIPQEENGWAVFNEARYHNPEYDALYDEAARETDPQRAAELFIQDERHSHRGRRGHPAGAAGDGEVRVGRGSQQGEHRWRAVRVAVWNIANWNRTG